MKLVNFNKYDLSKINNLVQSQLGNINLNKQEGYVLLDDNLKIKGYTILKNDTNKNIIKIDWIYAIEGYGTEFIKRIEKILFKNYSKIILNVSIDPTEDKNTVMKRINFYIKNKYKVNDIKFRKKNGPLLCMYKNK